MNCMHKLSTPVSPIIARDTKIRGLLCPHVLYTENRQLRHERERLSVPIDDNEGRVLWTDNES